MDGTPTLPIRAPRGSIAKNTKSAPARALSAHTDGTGVVDAHTVTTPRATQAEPAAAAGAAGGVRPGAARSLDTHTSKVVDRGRLRVAVWGQPERYEVRRAIQMAVDFRPAGPEWRTALGRRPRVDTATGEVLAPLAGALGEMPSAVGRLWACGRCAVGSHASVSDMGGVLGVGGVIRCGRAMVCPVCGGTIREARRAVADRALVAVEEHGLQASFVTLTVRHLKHTQLRESLELVRSCWADVVRTRAYRTLADQLGGVGMFSALEVTHGAHGWHPHLHLALIPGVGRWDKAAKAPATPGVYRLASDAEFAALAHTVVNQWILAVRKRGGQAGRRAQMVVRSWDGSGLAKYLSKTGGFEVAVGDDGTPVEMKARTLTAELTRGDYKQGSGSHPFELAMLAGSGDKKAGLLWWEYERGMRGLRWWRVSHHLADLLGITDDERTDEEIAADDDDKDGAVLLYVERTAWWTACAQPGLLASLSRAVARGGDAAALGALLDAAGFAGEWSAA